MALHHDFSLDVLSLSNAYSPNTQVNLSSNQPETPSMPVKLINGASQSNRGNAIPFSIDSQKNAELGYVALTNVIFVTPYEQGIHLSSGHVVEQQSGLCLAMGQSQITVQTLSPQLKCPICTDGEAGKHAYYGGRGCHSCRGFFRRSVQSQQYEQFSCRANKNCSIDSKSRKACQWCRFQKCLQSGMNVKYVMDSEQRKCRMKKRTQCVVKNPHCNVSMTPDELGLLFTNARSGMEGIFTSYVNTHYKTKGNVFELVDIVLHPRALTYEEVKKFERVDKQVIPGFFWNYEEVQKLSQNDREIIIKESFPLIFAMFWSITASSLSDLYWQKFQERIRKLFGNDMDQLSELREVEDKFKLFGDNIEQFPQVLELTESLKKGKYPTVSYEMVYSSPWASSSDEEDRHRFLSLKIDAWLMGQDGKQDIVTCWLIVLIMMFCPDYAGLSKRDHIGNIQTKYLCLLQKYLKLKYGKMANKKLHEGLMIKSYAEEAYKIHENMLRI